MFGFVTLTQSTNQRSHYDNGNMRSHF